jgi:hypothetical protein
VLIAATQGNSIDNFLAGMVLGILVGFLIGPVLWHWLAWHWWKGADREARLTDEVLERLNEDGHGSVAGAGARSHRHQDRS